MKLMRLMLLMCASILLIGCASMKPNIPLSDTFWNKPNQKIIVALTQAPKPEMHRLGPEGLLDMAVNQAMTNNLNQYINRMNMSWYSELSAKFASQLKQRHIEAAVADQRIQPDNTHYAMLTNGTGTNKLLLIKLEQVGAARFYNGFIPSGAPTGYCVMTGLLIDTSDNKIGWRYRAVISQKVSGEWDQAPGYPNLTVAMREAVNAAQEELLDSFFSGQ